MIKPENITNLFRNTAAKILVMLAFAGIALSAYPVYNSHNGIRQKIALIKEWNSLNYKSLPSETLDAVYEQVDAELNDDNGIFETTYSKLSNTALTYSPKTCILKAVTGGALYLLIYGMVLIYFLQLNRRRGVWRPLLKRNLHVPVIWIVMSAVNAAIPFYSAPINYAFIPSCLTLVVALMSLLWNEVYEHLDKINNPPKERKEEK